MPGLTIDGISAGPSRKRSRLGLDGEASGSGAADGDESTASMAQSAKKRARLSDPRERDANTPLTVIDDDEPAEPDDDQIDPMSQTRYEDLRDGNFEHLAHEEEDDMRATQLLRFRPNRLGENNISDNGIIERITCVNFMCHERLTCDLGPLLNFIVGENGSGKSAILTAITICLGGKASSTNRGGSLKSFIKEGRDRAILAVQIKNQGQGAYRPDVYGDSIIVERHFTKTGQSGFKVKSALNRIISTKKSEVDEIVEYFCLQVDNPLNVLSQDNARQFLNQATKEQKYKFFIEGVQLQQLDNDYRLIAESLEQNESKVPEQEERVKLARQSYDDAQRLKQIYENNEQLRVQHRNLGNQLAWAQVEEQERELENRRNTAAEAAKNVEVAAAAVVDKEALLASGQERVLHGESAIQMAKAAEAEHRIAVDEAAEKYAERDKELQAFHLDERGARSSAKEEKANAKDLEGKIATEQQRLAEANGDAPLRKRAELDNAKARLTEIQGRLQEKKEQEPELQARIKKAKDALAAIMDVKQAKGNEIRDVRGAIGRLEESRSSQYDGYEQKVPTLLKNIANEKRFRSRPIGPMGTLVSLLKPEWSSVLEAFLGKTLNGFIVTSVHDQKILTAMMKQAGVQHCPIIIGGQQPLNLDGKEPDDQFDTILRVLEFDDNVVRDQLVLNSAIEQIILVPERQMAQQIMFEGAPPRNVRVCLCNHDTRRGFGIRLTNNNGNIASQPVEGRPSRRPRMKANSGSQLAFLQESLRQLQNELARIEDDRRHRHQEHQQCIAELDQCKKEQRVLEQQRIKCEVEVNNCAADLDQFDGVDGRLRGLQEQLVEVQRKLDHFVHQFADIKVKKEQKKAEVDELRQNCRALEEEMENLQNKTSKAEAKCKQLSDGYQITVVEVNEAYAKVQEAEDAQMRAEAARDRQVARVQDYIRQAEQCHRIRLHIPRGQTTESLLSQHRTLEARIKEQQKKHGMSENQILEKYKEARQTYQRKVRDLQSIKKVNQGFKLALRERLVKWRQFQRNIGAHSRANFRLLLSERGFRGRLVINHEKRTLDLQIEPDRTERKAGGRSTKTLSGGEKSFSSICLLLSIWEAMGSPLRCLDEFDVFMDNVNRAISTNMLIDTARRSVNRQYIFITPNAIEGGKQYDKDVKIIRLSDPRQRTLD